MAPEVLIGIARIVVKKVTGTLRAEACYYDDAIKATPKRTKHEKMRSSRQNKNKNMNQS